MLCLRTDSPHPILVYGLVNKLALPHLILMSYKKKRKKVRKKYRGKNRERKTGRQKRKEKKGKKKDGRRKGGREKEERIVFMVNPFARRMRYLSAHIQEVFSRREA